MQQMTLQCNSKIANIQSSRRKTKCFSSYSITISKKIVIFALANMKSKITNRFAFLKQTINNLFLN